MPTNQLEKKQFPKDLALVGCTTLRSVTLTIAGWECYILLLPPVGDPNKRSPQFSLVFSGSETVFVWIPKNNALFWLLLRKKKKNVTAGNYTPKGPPTMSRVWRRTWHFKVRGFDHLQKQWFLVNRKPHHKKNTESHLVHTFYRSVFLLTFNVLWWKWVICLDPENCHTHHSFAGFQRLNEAAWFMDDGFAHPFIVSWSKAKHCEMREQCTVCNWEKNTWYKRLRWNQPFSFIMTDASRFHMISSNSSLHLHPICTRNIVEYLALQKKIWRCHPCTVLPPNLRTFSGILC